MDELSITQKVTIDKSTCSKHLHRWAAKAGLLCHPTVVMKLQELRTPVSLLELIFLCHALKPKSYKIV